jgi:hypothetical protein
VREAYGTHGEAFADWLHDRPVAKTSLRIAMDQVVAKESTDERGGMLRVSPPIDSPTTPFLVPAGKTVAVRAPTVCLHYGRREPTPRMSYRLVAIETVSEDPRLALILGGMAHGHVSQKVAQAAAWHLSSGRTWEQLAAEVIKQAGGDPDLPFFSAAELAAAQRAVAVADQMVQRRPNPEPVTESSSSP